jgi:hypothetical protein
VRTKPCRSPPLFAYSTIPVLVACGTICANVF